jgi:uncharacterized protein YceH (UPF0502 family)
MIPSVTNTSRRYISQIALKGVQNLSKKYSSFRRFSTFEALNQEIQAKVEKLEHTVKNLTARIDLSDRQHNSDTYKYAFGAVGAVGAAAFGASHINDKIKASEEHIEKRIDLLEKNLSEQMKVSSRLAYLEGKGESEKSKTA